MEALGYFTIRAAGSKGKTDVLCWDDRQYIHIQLKSFKTKPGSYAAELDRLRAVPVPPNGSREFWIWKFGEGWWRQIALGSSREEDAVFLRPEEGDAKARSEFMSIIKG